MKREIRCGKEYWEFDSPEEMIEWIVDNLPKKKEKIKPLIKEIINELKTGV